MSRSSKAWALIEYVPSRTWSVDWVVDQFAVQQVSPTVTVLEVPVIAQLVLPPVA